MPEIILTEAEFAALRSVVEEAQATTQRFDWLSGTARRITRDDITLPKLHLALDGVKKIDFENPRTMPKIEGQLDTIVDRVVVEKKTANANANQRRTGTTKK